MIIAFSFNDPTGKFNFTWQGFTLEHWGNAFGIPELNDALLTQPRAGSARDPDLDDPRHDDRAGAGPLSVLADAASANFLIVIPMTTPEVVMGASLLSMFLIYGITLGFTTLLIAHVMFCISFVVVVVRSRLIGFDRSLEEAARDLGANAFQTFRLVTLPLIMPGVVGAALLAFALSIDDFVVSNFNSGTTVTFPLYIFGAAQRSIPVEVNGIATSLFTLTVVAMGFTVLQQRRAERLAAIRPQQEGE